MTGELSAQLEAVGIWVSLLLALFTLSAIVRDNYLSRLAQHLFVGAALGYLVVLLVQSVLRPRLVTPLVQSGFSDIWTSIPAVLGVLLLAAGVDRSIGQGQSAESPPPAWRKLLHGLGMGGVAVLLGVSISTAVLGAVQGTLAPQFAQVMRSGSMASAASATVWSRWAEPFLMLLVTTGVLVHLYVEPALGHVVTRGRSGLRMGLMLWSWLGKRVLWLSAGILFGRLVLSRVSLLGAQIDYVVQLLQQTPLWRAVAALGQTLGL